MAKGSILIEFEFSKFSEGWSFVDAIEKFAADSHDAKGIKLTEVDKSVPRD